MKRCEEQVPSRTVLKRYSDSPYFRPLVMSLEEAEALPPQQEADYEIADPCEHCGDPKALFLALRDENGWVMVNTRKGAAELSVWCVWLCENCRGKNLGKAVIMLTGLYSLQPAEEVWDFNAEESEVSA